MAAETWWVFPHNLWDPEVGQTHSVKSEIEYNSLGEARSAL
jgi:hypothetical protein